MIIPQLLIFHLLSLVYLLVQYLLADLSGGVQAFLAGIIYAALLIALEVPKKRWSAAGYLFPAAVLLLFPFAHYLQPLFPVLVMALIVKSRFPRWTAAFSLLILPFLDTLQWPVLIFFGVTAVFIDLVTTQEREQILVLKHRLEGAEHENRAAQKRLRQLDRLDVEQEHLHRLEERHSISQKLHDQLGHRLSGSIYQLEAVQYLLSEDPVKSNQMIQNCSENLREGLDELRRGVRLVRPDSWDLRFQQLKEILARFEADTMIPVKTEWPAITPRLRQLPLDVIIANVREGLTNILKHSGAGEVSFSISVFQRLIRVRLRDNGKGAGDFKPGIGLAGMEDRTRQSGGQLVLDGSSGFSITMLFQEDRNAH